MTRRIGLISDTHGLLRPEAVEALAGSDLIIHCGDIGALAVIEGLRELCSVIAIRGNVDREPWAEQFPAATTVEVEGHRIHVVHDVNTLESDPAAEGFAAVVSGHSHRPSVTTQSGVLFVNPGSAGRRRFKLPVALGRLDVSAEGIEARVIELQV